MNSSPANPGFPLGRTPVKGPVPDLIKSATKSEVRDNAGNSELFPLYPKDNGTGQLFNVSTPVLHAVGDFF